MKRAYKRAVWESIPTAFLIFDERWNYKEGFDVAKENDRILVVRGRADIESPLSEILNDEMPKYRKCSTGIIDMSIPIQAKEEIEKND
ncbi:hypothetical protein M4D81_28035 [Paenibacillus sp. p3-SID867]|uniref:hypothetical protein n=1 Tax=Paenibacillus sp. p3-SID867 TaxID=2916363 RepID=UPI0021A3DB73|nr:hypothetical protein [Paenibacillus sp. p3-SID867]MCT1402849.1 hypothetical protein [Paenibacillus sp. p3-SID867]